MPLLDELFEGSFRGARFLIKSASTTGGRKQVKHEYPNSDKQKIEDLGFRPRVFTISAIIADDPPNRPGALTYTEKKEALLAALETAGNGTLSHPFFTNSVEVTARPYTLDETVEKLGEATIDLVFDFSDLETDPLPAATSLSQVNEKLEELNGLVELDIASNWNVSTIQNSDAATALLNGFAGAVTSATSTFNQVRETTNEFSALIGNFTSNIGGLIRAPQELAESIGTIVATSGGLYQTVDEGLEVFKRMFNFGDDIQTFPETTPNRIERNKNNRLISNATQVQYLGLSYQFAAEKEYTTVEEVTEQQERLEDQYNKIIEASDDTGDSDVINALTELRTLSNLFLETERLSAPQVISIETHRIPLSVLGFQYYAEDVDTLTPFLVDINRPKTNNPAFIDGDLEILTR